MNREVHVPFQEGCALQTGKIFRLFAPPSKNLMQIKSHEVAIEYDSH